MDRLIYVAMTGAKHTMGSQAATAHNLANATTTGYRAETHALRAAPVLGEGAPTRAFVVDSTAGNDFRSGPIQNTGRALDVAVQGPGWISVETEDGSEAYTRAGDLELNANGVLQTRSGLNVTGDGGTISIPPDSTVTIAKDGTVSVVPSGSQSSAVVVVGRIKLVNPPEADLVRGADGLFRLPEGESADADAAVTLVSGALEGSNVNVVDSLIDMISLSRQFDLQVKLLENAEANSRQANQLLALNR